MYKHYDKDGAAISLHDCKAEKATFEKGILTFYFPEDGFWICSDHEENSTGEAVRTDASEVRFHLLYETEDESQCYVFDKKSERKSVRKEWTISELVSAINSGKYQLEFLYRYAGGYKELVFTCEICQEKKPYRRECQLWLSVQDVTYCWNEIAECYRE
mgnify:CR=1 FL=1